MTKETTKPDEDAPKGGVKGLIFGMMGAVLLGAAAFFVTYTGIFPTGGGGDAKAVDSHGNPVDITHAAGNSGVVFVALDPLIISLGRYATSRHLRFQAHLEVAPAAESEVQHLLPRVSDVLNTYLRAISEEEMEDPASMNRLRAQMLRRVQVVVGEDNVRDLLITEFVLN